MTEWWPCQDEIDLLSAGQRPYGSEKAFGLLNAAAVSIRMDVSVGLYADGVFLALAGQNSQALGIYNPVVRQQMFKKFDPAKQRKDIFLLTKPPHSDRAKLCLQLIASSRNAVLYLAGDGVYNLLGEAPAALPPKRIVACQEDLKARGVQVNEIATVPVDFYELLMDDVMSDEARVYTF